MAASEAVEQSDDEEEYIDIKNAVMQGDVQALRNWLKGLDKRCVLADVTKCPYIKTELGCVVLLALEAGQMQACCETLDYMHSKGFYLQLKYATAMAARLLMADPSPTDLVQLIIRSMLPEDKAFMQALFSQDKHLGAALRKVEDWEFQNYTALQRIFDMSKKHYHYRHIKHLSQHGLPGRLANEWAAIVYAAKDRKFEEVFGIVHGSFEPILLTMVGAHRTAVVCVAPAVAIHLHRRFTQTTYSRTCIGTQCSTATVLLLQRRPQRS